MEFRLRYLTERGEAAVVKAAAEKAGWQPHTARAALTRLRQRGFMVHLREAEGRKAYHLTQATRR